MFDSSTVKYNGKPVSYWFLRKLFTEHGDETKEGAQEIAVLFKTPCDIEIEGNNYLVTGISCTATRIHKNKRKWVHWSGDAFYDWHTGLLTIPAKGEMVGSAVESDLTTWPDYNGEVPKLMEGATSEMLQVVLFHKQKWDSAKDGEVPDLSKL